MSETLEAIKAAPDAPQATARRPSGPRGVAPTIRKLKTRYPEMTQPEIAKRVGCSVDNVQKVLRRYNRAASVEELRGFQENKADIVDHLAHRVVMSITDAKLKKMSASQAFIALGIAIDKSQLLHGLPTGINVSVLMDVVEAIRLRGTQPVVAPASSE